MSSIISQRITERREALRWSRYKLSKKAGVSSGYISDLENGVKANPSAEVLARIAEALGTTMEYLRGHTDDPRPLHQIEIVRADMPFRPPGWDQLSEEERNRVRQVTQRFEEAIIADMLREKKERERQRHSRR